MSKQEKNNSREAKNGTESSRVQKFFHNLTPKKVTLIFFIIGFLIYGNALNSPFIMDDQYTVQNNIFLTDWKYLPQIFSQNLFAGGDGSCNYWRPIETLSLAIDYRLGGSAPFVYHLDNLLWHIFASSLLYSVLLRLTKNNPASFLTALIFLIHPLQIEAVTFITGRGDPMSAVFTLASFLFFWHYSNDTPKLKHLLASLFFFSLSLLTHERSLVFPAILILYFFTAYENLIFTNWKKKLMILAPFAIITLAYLLLRLIFINFGSEFNMLKMNGYSPATLPLVYLRGIAIYAGLLFFPASLYMERMAQFPGSFFDSTVILGTILVIASIVIFFVALKKNKLVAFFIGWFWIFLSLSLYALPSMGFLWDHWLYLPMVGFWMPLALIALGKIDQTKKAFVRIGLIILIVLFLLGFSVRSIIRNEDWNYTISFFEKALESGACPTTLYNVLGMVYVDSGRLEEAKEAFQKSIASGNQMFEPFYNLGMTYERLGEPDHAIEMLELVLKKNPLATPAYDELQKLYVSEGRLDDAINVTQKALMINPNDTFMLANLGILYGNKGDFSNARNYLEKAVELDPHTAYYKEALEELASVK